MKATKESRYIWLLNIVTALYLMYAMPQQILFTYDGGWLKVVSVICVDICAVSILTYSAYKVVVSK